MLLQREADIAQLKMLGNSPEEIANELHLEVSYVNEVVKSEKVIRWMEEAEISALSRGVELSRLRSARDLIGTIMTGIRKIAEEVDAEKWNKNHVELFKLLLQNLAKEDAKALTIIQNNFIQQNNVQVERSALSGLDEKLSKIPAREQVNFWRDVEALVDKYMNHAKSIEILPK